MSYLQFVSKVLWTAGVASVAGDSLGEGDSAAPLSVVCPETAGETDGDAAGLACEELSSAGMDGEGDAVWAPSAGSEAQAAMKRKDQDTPWHKGEVIVFVG